MRRNSIECWSLTKLYGRFKALDSVTLSVAPGELFGLLGPNGAGKSSLLKILVGLVRPSSGWAQTGGFPPGHMLQGAQVGYLPELFRFHEWMTGAELLNFHGRLLKMPASELRARIDMVLELTGLSSAGDRKIAAYSKGMQQRIGLAQAVLGRPKVLFLDEPTSALDPIGRAHVRVLLEGLAAEGTTIFLNSHLLTDVERICTRMAIMNDGRIVKEGSLSDLVGAPRLRIVLDKLSDDLMAAVRRRFGAADVTGAAEFLLEIDDREMIPQIANFLVAEKRRIYEISEENGSLEQAFLRLLGAEAH